MLYSMSMATQLEKYARVNKADTDWFVGEIVPYAHNIYTMSRTSEQNNVHLEAHDSASLKVIRVIARERGVRLEAP